MAKAGQILILFELATQALDLEAIRVRADLVVFFAFDW